MTSLILFIFLYLLFFVLFLILVKQKVTHGPIADTEQLPYRPIPSAGDSSTETRG